MEMSSARNERPLRLALMGSPLAEGFLIARSQTRSELNPDKTIIRIWLLSFLSRKTPSSPPFLFFFGSSRDAGGNH